MMMAGAQGNQASYQNEESSVCLLFDENEERLRTQVKTMTTVLAQRYVKTIDRCLGIQCFLLISLAGKNAIQYQASSNEKQQKIMTMQEVLWINIPRARGKVEEEVLCVGK